jgi:hypothetical protein
MKGAFHQFGDMVQCVRENPENRQMLTRRFDAAEMISAACIKHQVHLATLVAETALWAHPQTHFRQVQQNGSAAVYPGIRRLRPGQGEKRGITNGVGLDDNSYPNLLIKRSLGINRAEVVGYGCCHVWPNSCYDTRYHTVIANLVLIPAALASLTDYDPEVQAALQYRAFELYRWHPDEKPTPLKPARYPENWTEPQPDPSSTTDWPRPSGRPIAPRPIPTLRDREPVRIEKLRLWAVKPGSNVHRIIALMCDHSPISRDQLVKKIEALGFSQNPYGAIASLMTNQGTAYGRVFVERVGGLYIHPDIEDATRRLWNRPRAPIA